MWLPQSDCECSVINKTPASEGLHVEGYIWLRISKDCSYHSKYLDLKNATSNDFSIELIEQLEKEYEETC